MHKRGNEYQLTEPNSTNWLTCIRADTRHDPSPTCVRHAPDSSPQHNQTACLPGFGTGQFLTACIRADTRHFLAPNIVRIHAY